MFKKEIIGKNSVFILYVFVVSLLAAVLHVIYGETAGKDNLPRYIYFGLPLFIGLMTIISWRWVKLDFRVTSQNSYENNTMVLNVVALSVVTCFISVLGLHPFTDSVIIVGTIFYVTNKLVNIQTAHSSVVKLPQVVREGILKSNYFFWKLYEHDGLREFVVVPNQCAELKIYSNMLEEKLILQSKQIKHRYLKAYEKEFEKTLFDFNKEDLTILAMAEI